MMTGSTWRKWDLHFHSPSSYDYQNKTVTNQEIIDTLFAKKIEVVAITDHHTIDIERIKELQKLGKGRVTVLPGIEFRSELGGSESIHFIGIFPEDSDMNHIWVKIQSTCGLTEKDVKEKGGDENLHCDLKETSKLIRDLGGLISVHAGSKSNTIEKITNSLPYKMAMKTELVINHIDFLELGKEVDQQDYNNIVFPAIEYRLPMIICTDNHCIRNYSVKQNLWIKGDPTFEGLKQILFEPVYRVHVGESPPVNPPIRINKVSLEFPPTALFDNEPFCLRGKREIQFSPNYTCLIGGRGTGKSTILNLLHEKLRPGENSFFRENKVTDDAGTLIPVEECVTVDNDADEKYIEFLGQNEVEEFAKNYHKLTNAIYSRIIKRDEQRQITKNEEQLKERLQLFKRHIVDKRQMASYEVQLARKQKEFGANQRIIESFSSDEYIGINTDITSISRTLNSLIASHDEYLELLADLNAVVERHQVKDETNVYAQEIAVIRQGVEKLLTDTQTVDFSIGEKAKAELANELGLTKGKLMQYLSDKGLTPENQKDIAYANVIAGNLADEIKKQSEEIEAIINRIDKYVKEDAVNASTEYKNELEKQIKVISSLLEKLENESVKPISLQLDFDIDAASDQVFSDFKLVFEGQISLSNHKGDAKLKEILFCVPPNELTDKDALLTAIRNHTSTSTAKQFLLELLSKESNFELYKLLAEMHFLDYSTFKRIRVQYNKRPIESTSFGQRCTAVLVILLLLGNNPIIIDEPEAHLDSLLISNYLVEVIKDFKRNRQIVFATHNANFVINGDAELIHVLDIDESGQTTILSTTIENPQTREILIGLEGGREAFNKREHRYQ